MLYSLAAAYKGDRCKQGAIIFHGGQVVLNFAPKFLVMATRVVTGEIQMTPSDFTYCNDNGTVTSWIDHFLCSRAIDVLTVDVNILYHYITSDRKPLLMSLGNIDVSGTVLNLHNVNVDACFGNTVID